MRVNLGCGNDIRKGWINVDKNWRSGVEALELDRPAPWDFPTSIQGVSFWYASHLLEHLDWPLNLFEAMWHASNPNATAIFRVPHGASDAAWEDPTHVRPIFPLTFQYFAQPFYWRADYGYRGDWKVDEVTYYLDGRKHGWPEHVKVVPPEDRDRTIHRIQHERNWVAEMAVKLSVVKPIRPPRADLITPFTSVIEIAHV